MEVNHFFFFLLVFLLPWNHRRETEWIIGLRLFINDLTIWVLSIFFLFPLSSFFLTFFNFSLVFLSPFLYFTLFFFLFFIKLSIITHCGPTLRNFCRHTPYRIYHTCINSLPFMYCIDARKYYARYISLCQIWITGCFHFRSLTTDGDLSEIHDFGWRAPPVATIEVPIWLMQSHMKFFKHEISQRNEDK